MKFRILPVAALALFTACSGDAGKNGNADSVPGNNIAGTNNFILEELLAVADEAALKKQFGEAAVRHDTIWGPEGMFFMGTLLFPGTEDEVEISWEDTVKNAKMLSAQTTWHMDDNGNWKKASRWKSQTGIKLGTTLKELEKLNESPFKFYGFGWDYGGMVSGWENGKLNEKRVFIELGTASTQYNTPAYEKLLGDGEFRSDDANAQTINPVVVELSVSHNRP